MSRDHAQPKQKNAGTQAQQTAARQVEAPEARQPDLVPGVMLAEQVSRLQRRVGNRAVNAYLGGGYPVLQAKWLQRIPDPPAVWNMPFELGEANSHEQARIGLLQVVIRLGNLESLIGEREGADGADPEARQALRDYFDEARSYSSAFEQDGPLVQSEARNLNSYGQEIQQFHDQQLAAARRRLERAVTPIAEVQAQDTTQLEEDLAEELHYAFIEGAPDRITAVQDALDKIKEYNERVQQVATWGSRISGQIRMARTADVLSSIARGSEQVGEILGKVGHVITAARALGTIAGITNQAAGESQTALNQFEQGLAVVDIAMTFADAIPLIGSLWSDYYYPAAQACIRMLRVIARHRDRDVRDWAQLDWEQARIRGMAPRIPEGCARFFPGGQSVLDFVYGVMIGNSPAVTPGVENFFLEHLELFNAGRGSGGEIETTGPRWYNPLSWLEDRHIPGLLNWVQAHRAQVWAMLYGNIPVPA